MARLDAFILELRLELKMHAPGPLVAEVSLTRELLQMALPSGGECAVTSGGGHALNMITDDCESLEPAAAAPGGA